MYLFEIILENTPLQSKSCMIGKNKAHESRNPTCPHGQHCVLNDFHCFFFECPIAKGFCIKEPQIMGSGAQ